jgi:hypothetical protein
MLLAVGAYEGGAHALLLPQMPFRGGARVSKSLYAILITWTPKGTEIASKWFINKLASASAGVCLPTRGVFWAIYN